MSRPAPTNQKANTIQTILLMVAIFFGMQFFFNRNTPPNAAQTINTTQHALAALQDDDKKVFDKAPTSDAAQKIEADTQQHLSRLSELVDTDTKNRVIPVADGEALKMQGAVLAADVFLKDGVLRSDTGKCRQAYQFLQGFERRASTTPGWTAQQTTVSDPAIPQGAITPELFCAHTISVLSDRNKTDLVWGFIPGGYQMVDTLVSLTGKNPSFSFAFAAFLLAFAVRAVVYPLSQKQLMFSRQMSQLTPRVMEIKNKYAEDQVEQNKRIMDLYKEYGINPAQGCLPALVQMPLFLTVYQCMLHYQFEFVKGHFLWINPTTSAASHGFFAANLGQQDSVLIVIYGITMTISSLLTPVTDPTQFKQQRIMGVGMAIAITVFMFFGVFPVVAGFVLYWTFTNLLATAQSWRAYRLPMPPLVKVNAPAGGVYPTSGIKGRWMQMIDEAQKMAEKPRPEDSEPTQGPTNGKPISNGKSAKIPQLPDGAASKNGSGGDAKSAKSPKYKPKKRS